MSQIHEYPTFEEIHQRHQDKQKEFLRRMQELLD